MNGILEALSMVLSHKLYTYDLYMYCYFASTFIYLFNHGYDPVVRPYNLPSAKSAEVEKNHFDLWVESSLNNPIGVGHTNFLYNVELPYAQDPGSSPKSLGRLSTNI